MAKGQPVGELEYSLRDFYVDDAASNINRPGAKALINLITVILLGHSFRSINDSFFTSVAIFAIPMLFEFMRFFPSSRPRQFLRSAERILLYFICFICLLGILGVLHIQIFEHTPYIIVDADYAVFSNARFPALALWGGTVLSFVICMVDVFTAKPKAESIINGYRE